MVVKTVQRHFELRPSTSFKDFIDPVTLKNEVEELIKEKDESKFTNKLKHFVKEMKELNLPKRKIKIVVKKIVKARKKRGNAALVGGLVTTILMLILGIIVIAYFYDAAPNVTDPQLNQTLTKGKEMTNTTFNLAWMIPIALVAGAVVGFLMQAFGGR